MQRPQAAAALPVPLLERLASITFRSRSWGARYVFALALVAVALLVRLAIAPLSGGIQYVTFFPAVALAAVVGGLWPGLIAAGVSAALASFFFWPPFAAFSFEFSHSTVLSNVVFLLDAVLVSAAIEAMHRFYRRFVDAEQQLQLAATVFVNSAEGIVVTDASAIIQAVNPAFTRITGYSEQEALGQKPSLLRSDRHDPAFYEELWRTLATDGQWQGEVWNRRKDGEAYLEWLTINRVHDASGRTIRYVGVFHDITELRAKDERIRHMAFHDALTGLPNRSLMLDRLEHALSRAKRERLRLAVTFIDLDRFKAINDSLGHDIGDLLLQEVATRIRGRIRAMDTVARLGGDEFVVLMEEIQTANSCTSLAEQLIAEISRPMNLRGHQVQVGASMGVAFFPEDGDDAMTLMKSADMAMYAAKSGGRNTYRFFERQMLDSASQRPRSS